MPLCVLGDLPVREAINAKKVAAVLRVPQRFSADVLAGREAQVQLLLDARRSNTAFLAQGYAGQIVSAYNQELHPGTTPLVVLVREWFNPTPFISPLMGESQTELEGVFDSNR